MEDRKPQRRLGALIVLLAASTGMVNGAFILGIVSGTTAGAVTVLAGVGTLALAVRAASRLPG